MESQMRYDVSLLTDDDLYFFNEGTHSQLSHKMGAHLLERAGTAGVYFAVWAPNAEAVFVKGDFNGWADQTHPLRVRGSSGIWEGFLEGLSQGALYKYHIRSRHTGYTVDKADPFASLCEHPPKTASVVWQAEHAWGDDRWMARREGWSATDAPVSIYELHLGSWMRTLEGDFLSYRDLAPKLVEYIQKMGFTHIELMPFTEHPFYGSWGYQTTGYFAPTHRHGKPEDLMFLIDALHQADIGVILDWVPSHFPSDQHALSYFDGTHLFEHEDPRRGVHPDWGSLLFNYGRNEVRSFLISSASHWIERFHIDGLRVDAVASMLYLDYSRKEGEWLPNKYGGREHLEAIDFLRQLNGALRADFPGVQLIAEESTAWPAVSRPVEQGGLGFHFKWDMGWMHDTLSYFQYDPIYRQHHHNQLTFRMMYAFTEQFVLALSHDEVVHGKGSLLNKMPGDDWQKRANLRLLFGYMYGQPGKKLLFMGCEWGQTTEWSHEHSLPWHQLEDERHLSLTRWVADLNRLYRGEPALHQQDSAHEGFQWLDCDDAQNSTLSFLRKASDGQSVLLVFNMTPVIREMRFGVPKMGRWEELLNSDAEHYGGSGVGNFGAVQAQGIPWQGQPASVNIKLPPLAVLFFRGASEAFVSEPLVLDHQELPESRPAPSVKPSGSSSSKN